MKIILTIALLLVINILFAQNDTPVKGIPVKVLKDGKVIVGVKPAASNADSNKKMTLQVDTSKIGGFAKMTDVFRTNMTFWEKCKYWFFWLKKEQPYMFWPLLIMICIWILRLIFKLFSR